MSFSSIPGSSFLASTASSEELLEQQQSTINTLHSSVICSLCNELVFDPVIVCDRGHTFDNSCIVSWQQNKTICPSCDTPLLPRWIPNLIAEQNRELYLQASITLAASLAPRVQPVPTDVSEASPFNRALENNDLQGVQVFLNYGFSFTPADVIAHVKSPEMFELLLKGADPAHGRAFLSEALQAKDYNSITWLLNTGVSLPTPKRPTTYSNIADPSLLEAFANNNLEAAEALLDKTDNLTYIDAVTHIKSSEMFQLLLRKRDQATGHKLLSIAIWHNRYDSLISLLQAGAFIFTRDPPSALHIASELKNYQALFILLSLDINKDDPSLPRNFINESDDNLLTPLMLACGSEENSAKCVKLLLERGANPYIPNRQGRLPLEVAKAAGNQDLIALLEPQENPLYTAFSQNNLEAARKLLEQRTQYTYNGLSLALTPNTSNVLHTASRNGSTEELSLLLDHLSQTNVSELYINALDERGYTPLALACFSNTECVPLLQKHGATLDALKATTKHALLHRAIVDDNLEALRTLLKLGALMFTPPHPNALHVACRCKNSEALSLLLTHIAQTGATDPYKDTPDAQGAPLIQAVGTSAEAIACVDVLLAHGANVEVKDPQGQSLRQIIEFHNHPPLTAVFQKHNYTCTLL